MQSVRLCISVFLKIKTMKVKAKYQIAYKGILYNGGDVFDLDAADLETYKNDVEVVEKQDKKAKEKDNKILKNETNK